MRTAVLPSDEASFKIHSVLKQTGVMNETGHAVLKTNAMNFSGVSRCRGTTTQWNMQTICERHFTLVRQMRKA